MSDFFCTGCSRYYPWKGFSGHLSQTRRPACIAVRAEQEALFPGLFDLVTDNMSHQLPAYDATRETRPFEGDHLGSALDYHNDDFPWPTSDGDEAPDESESESDSDSDFDELPVDDTAGEHGVNWVPPPSLVPTPEPMDEDLPLDDQLTLERRREMVQNVQRLGRRPAVVVTFGGNAGRVVPQPPNAQLDEFGYTTYQSSLGAAARDNPWYPFQSKLDWEVAKWAKLRGPGDTAFSELLAIEGVSFVFAHAFPHQSV